MVENVLTFLHHLKLIFVVNARKNFLGNFVKILKIIVERRDLMVILMLLLFVLDMESVRIFGEDIGRKLFCLIYSLFS